MITCRYSFEVLDFHCYDFGFTFNIGVSYLGIYKTSMSSRDVGCFVLEVNCIKTNPLDLKPFLDFTAATVNYAGLLGIKLIVYTKPSLCISFITNTHLHLYYRTTAIPRGSIAVPSLRPWSHLNDTILTLP